jgi:hypothetical protein
MGFWDLRDPETVRFERIRASNVVFYQSKLEAVYSGMDRAKASYPTFPRIIPGIRSGYYALPCPGEGVHLIAYL